MKLEFSGEMAEQTVRGGSARQAVLSGCGGHAATHSNTQERDRAEGDSSEF